MNHHLPLVSVVIPVFNTANFLSRCVDSVLQQDYANLQIILVDDASTDNSLDLCRQYAQEYPNILLVEHETNRGLSCARNSGLSLAHGEFIVFVDSDDFILQSFISRMVGVSQSEPKVDIVQCGHLKFSNTPPENYPVSGEAYSLISSVEALRRIYDPQFSTDMVIVPNKLYKRSLFKGIQFPVGRYHEDEATTYLLFFEARSLAILEDKMYCYYQNLSGITKGLRLHNKNRAFDALTAFRERFLFYKSNDISFLLKPTKMRILGYYTHIANEYSEYHAKAPSDIRIFLSRVQEWFSNDVDAILLNGPIRLDWRIVLKFARNDFWRLSSYSRLVSAIKGKGVLLGAFVCLAQLILYYLRKCNVIS